jgi:ATP sulfurylase
MHKYIDTNQDIIHFTISLSIIDVIIKELFYCDNDQILVGIDEVDEKDEKDHRMNMERIRKKAEKNIALKCNAMKLFKFDEDNKMYIVNIPNNMHFFLAIDYVNRVQHVISLDRCHDSSCQGPP